MSASKYGNAKVINNEAQRTTYTHVLNEVLFYFINLNFFHQYSFNI